MVFRKNPYAYFEFRKSVSEDYRYVHSDEVRRFLDDVSVTAGRRLVELEEGSELWRAQIGFDTEEVLIEDTGTTVGQEVPFNEQRMIPRLRKQIAGRVNPGNINCVYLAREKDTAVAEVRPWLGARVSVAKFTANKNLKIVDCLRNEVPRVWVPLGKPPENCEFYVWSQINDAFAMPVDPRDESKAYVPTQVLAELFRRDGYDGISYTSSLRPGGLNIALFDMSAVQVVSRQLCTVNGVKYEFDCDSPR